MTFHAIVHKAEEGGYWAEVPSIPGCATHGETMEELKAVMRDQRSWGVDILTVGQYLQPSKKHLPIARYYTPEEFREILTTFLDGLGL